SAVETVAERAPWGARILATADRLKREAAGNEQRLQSFPGHIGIPAGPCGDVVAPQVEWRRTCRFRWPGCTRRWTRKDRCLTGIRDQTCDWRSSENRSVRRVRFIGKHCRGRGRGAP